MKTNKNRKEYIKQWAKNNKDKVDLSHKRYAERNKDKYKKWNANWRKNNPERMAFLKYRRKDEVKREVMFYYGKGKIECCICGYKDTKALCLDHIDNNGKQHRIELNISQRGQGAGSRTYEALVRNGLPDGLQILCANCNMIKEQYRHLENRMKNKLYAEYYNSTQL